MKFYGFLLIFTAFLSVSTLAAIIQVPGDQPDIQAGIDAALNGDTVLVADGTYTGDGNRDVSFNGKAIAVMSQNGAESCVIDCEGSSADQHRGFNLEDGESFESMLKGFTIQTGYLENPQRGGGIRLRNSSPSITGCTISNNIALDSGGILCINSSPVISNCTISYNTGGMSGGGILCSENSSPTIINCTIDYNVSRWGGGIACLDSSPTITNCSISNNTSHGRGGISCINSSPTISNCIISSNNSTSMSGVGGGIYCQNSAPSIFNCIISKNIVDWKGGGGIFCTNYSSPMVINCSIIKNEAMNGGGIYSTGGSAPTIINCTIAKNVGLIDGPGIYCSVDSDLTIKNSIVWRNTPGDVADEFGDANISYSNIEKGYPGVGNIDIYPSFVTDNPHYNFDPHLSADSPCIDAGTDWKAPAVDLDGNNRPQGGSIDMGAYEFIGWPSYTRSYVQMPAHHFLPGDVVTVYAKVWNAGLNTLRDYPFWVILDLYGQLYFAPDFDGVNCYSQEFPPGLTEIPVLPPFIWPEGIESAEGVLWYAALTSPEMNEIVGEMGVFDFGWSE